MFSGRLLHPSLDLCMPNTSVNSRTQYVYKKILYKPSIRTEDFGEIRHFAKRTMMKTSSPFPGSHSPKNYRWIARSSLSIGMQYLYDKTYQSMYCNTASPRYHIALLRFSKSSPCTISDKLLHLQKFIFTPSFETLRVMKDEFIVALENELILDGCRAFRAKEGRL